MAHYVTTVKTDWDPATAYAYLAEFSNVAEWDPGVKAARSLSEDPLAVGARFEVTASGFGGREIPLTYETTEADPPRRVVLRAENSTLISLDTLTFEPAGGGTEVTYDADLSLKGPLRVFDLGLRLVFGRIGDAARDGLAERLAGPPPERPGGDAEPAGG